MDSNSFDNEIDNSIVDSFKLPSDSLSTLIIYPNPFGSSINIEIKSPDVKQASISIIDAMGKIIMAEKHLNTTIIPLDLSSFNNGVYILKIEYGNTTIIKKIIKK